MKFWSRQLCSVVVGVFALIVPSLDRTAADASLNGLLPRPVAAPLPKLPKPAATPLNTGSADLGLASFPIFTEGPAVPGSFVPSGFMGDLRDLLVYPATPHSPAVGKTCMKIVYTAEGAYDDLWVGMFWQAPRPGAGPAGPVQDRSGLKHVTFWARGEQGGEIIDFFKVGAAAGGFHDSGSAQIGPVTLTREWKKYTIDLSAIDRTSIQHPFGWTAGFFDNPHGITFYLDEIQFER